MKVLTNENNINALKIVIASKISKKPVDVHTDSVNKLNLEAPRTVPQLVLDSGVHVFSSNSAAKFLLLPSKGISTVNYYLDLEAAVLQPLAITINSKLTDEIAKTFKSAAAGLDKELGLNRFLAGNEITACDISIWCTLYPLVTDSKIEKELFSNLGQLKKWFEAINRLPEVQDALSTYPVKKGSSSLASSASVQTSKPPPQLASSPTKLPTPGATAEKTQLSVTEKEIKAAVAGWSDRTKASGRRTSHPVLPVPGERNVLVTSALPYVNNVPHLGNIIGCVLSGDVFARYCRLRGYNTLYVSGTDEYGTATETKALEEGLTPKEICDKYFAVHDAIYKWFNIQFDCFGRTTTPQQTEICQEIFKRVYDNGYILVEPVEQLLCEKCDRYLADRFVEGTCPRCGYEDARGDQCDGCGHLINAPELIKPRCKMCKQMPVLRESKQFFLDLPKIEPMLRRWIGESWTTWSHNAREISKAWLADGLKPRCITRDLKWGIPVPVDGYRNKVFYVWFDAPIGYMSITKTYTEKWQQWWSPEPGTNVQLCQFMAKDNVPFHSVMFPASLLATEDNFVLASNIFATEYLNYEDGKFSKSRGIGVFGNDAQDTGIPADVWRFYLLYVRPETQDSSFSWSDLALKNNSELLNVLGNFINRALMFCEKNYGSKVPDMNLTDDDYDLIALVNRELSGYVSMLEKGKLREGIRHLLSIARLGNQFMQSSQPWVLCKGSADDRKRGETVIGISINLACVLAQLLGPFMPETSDMVRRQLNCPPETNRIEDRFRRYLAPGHVIGTPFPLFGKIEDQQIKVLKEKYAGRQGSQPKSSVPSFPSDVEGLEAAVAAQGDVVRKMKAAGKDKSEWGSEVTVLLELKKRLAEAQKSVGAPEPVSTPKTSDDVQSIKQMEEEVMEQGNKVRKLKESGASKSEWQPEVNILLELKKKLAELKGEPLAQPSSGKKNKKK